MPHTAAGTRTEPPVSEPRAKSAAPPATAEADPLEEPRDAAGGIAVDRRPVMEILALQAIGELVGDGLADEIGAGSQKPVDRRGVRGRRRMAGEPVGIAAARDMARDVVDSLAANRSPRNGPPGAPGSSTSHGE